MAAVVTLPTFHADQVRAFVHVQAHRFSVVRCGRRWGKTVFGEIIGSNDIIKGAPVGWFAPDYKTMAEAYNELHEYLEPVIKTHNRTEGVLRSITGGRIDFWTLENERAGRSRKYKRVIIDEAAFTKDNAIEIWERAIKPTLLDYRGSALVISNTNGEDPNNFLWKLCNEPKWGFADFHAPTRNNPYMPAEELADLKAKTHPLVWAQEYEATFVNWSGAAFFSIEKMYENGGFAPWPVVVDYVFAVIDTAIKAGSNNDGTAVIYFAMTQFTGQPALHVLDYDIVQIEGASLEHWVPSVFARVNDLAASMKCRLGPSGAWIEDANSGTILLQHAPNKGWPLEKIDSRLTLAGKDGRALSVSTYVEQRMVKITQAAADKVVSYHGTEKNHLISQINGFRIGDKQAATRADDLLDCFCYGIAIALGNSEGY